MTHKLPENIATLAVDAQPTFCEGGQLPVDGGHEIMPMINKLRSLTRYGYWTKDWHPRGHCSFAQTHDRKPFTKVWMKDGEIIKDYEGETSAPEKGAVFQTLWPVHGVQGTNDAALHPDLCVPETDPVLEKGTDPEIDAYSAVWKNDRQGRPKFPNGRSLVGQLRHDGVDTVVVCGLAMDVCVADTACDLADENFRTIVIGDATSAISKEGEEKTRKRFQRHGVEIVCIDKLEDMFEF